MVVGQIEDLQIYCRYGLELGNDCEWGLDEDGCKEILTLGKREQHEDICHFALVSCPNSELCGQIFKKDLEKHSSNCVQHACQNINNGMTLILIYLFLL